MMNTGREARSTRIYYSGTGIITSRYTYMCDKYGEIYGREAPESFRFAVWPRTEVLHGGLGTGATEREIGGWGWEIGCH